VSVNVWAWTGRTCATQLPFMCKRKRKCGRGQRPCTSRGPVAQAACWPCADSACRGLMRRAVLH
jgi:hypothetical protein